MRRTIALLAAVSLAAAGSALADAGAPGTTFPEQPSDNNQRGCAAIASNPAFSSGGQFEQHASPTAVAIGSGLFADACLGG